MDTVIGIVLWGHIAVAFTGVAAFWVPVSARKGGNLHKLFGKLFAWCAYLVSGSAMILTTLRLGQILAGSVSISDDPEGGGLTVFLGYLAILTMTCIRHAVRVLDTRDDHEALRTPLYVSLAVACMLGSLVVALVAFLFWSRLSVLVLLLSPIGLLLGGHILRYMSRPPTRPRAWLFEHMGGMLGAGIAFHTAFAVFGLGRLFGLAPQGPWWFLPWVVPSAIGIPSAILWIRVYQSRLRGLGSEDGGSLTWIELSSSRPRSGRR